MAIQLTPDQIPMFWEAIKYASINADQVEKDYRERYLNRLLYQLLSGKAQCFIRLGKDRRLEAIAITKITIDEIRDEKSLFIGCLYSFKKVSTSYWKDDFESLKKLAKKNDCKFISCWIVNEKVSELAKIIGMEERFKSYILEV
jgi:hypothetical protein